MIVMNETIDLIPITQDDVQTIVTLATIIITHVMRGKTTTRDGIAELFGAVTKFQSFAYHGFAFGVWFDIGMVHHGFPMLKNIFGRARKFVSLPQVRVHDLKHTFGRRLRAAGVSYEDRQDLLGHKSGRITTRYSSAELQNLIEAANKACDRNRQGPVFTLLRINREESSELAGHNVTKVAQSKISSKG
jgi:integrase